MTLAEITALFMAAVAALSLLAASFRNNRQDAAGDAQVKSDLNYIKNRIDEMLIDQKALAQNMGELNVRIARCEESAKQAHRRIDEHVGGRGGAEEDGKGRFAGKGPF